MVPPADGHCGRIVDGEDCDELAISPGLGFGVHRVKHTRLTSRRAVAAVEAALTLPLLVLLVFGSIELGRGIFFKQTLSIAAYEGARAVSRAGATSADGQTRIDEFMASRQVTGYSVTFSPPVTTVTPRGTQLTVTVSAPVPGGGLGPLQLLWGQTYSKQVHMVRL